MKKAFVPTVNGKDIICIVATIGGGVFDVFVENGKTYTWTASGQVVEIALNAARKNNATIKIFDEVAKYYWNGVKPPINSKQRKKSA